VKIVQDAVTIPSYVEISPEGQSFLGLCLQKNPEQRANIRELLNHEFFKKYPDKNDKKVGF
jgi:serine/threonine protein kinase